MFAPADISNYDNGPQPNTGFFFTWDKMYVNVSQPEGATRDYDGDYTWGTRFDFGYMADNDKGWLIEYFYINGPTEFENSASWDSIEVNRTWRWDELHGGSIVEPFVGVRYIDLETGHHDSFTFPHVENNMIGPQVGLRWYKQNERWLISAEGRYFYAHNEQFYDDRNKNGNVTAGDLRLEAEYKLWKSFSVRGGFEFLHMAKGVARGVNNDEDTYFYGWTFGFVVNR